MLPKYRILRNERLLRRTPFQASQTERNEKLKKPKVFKEQIEYSKEIKYLGLTQNEKLNRNSYLKFFMECLIHQI